MTTYDVTYVNNQGHQDHISVIATDVRHAINQVLELKPECRVTSALPETMWTDDETHTK